MPPPKKAKTSAEDVPADGGVAQPASASLQRTFSPGGLLSETARRELELQRREEELAQRERELRRREGLLSVQHEQADAVVKVKRERLASSATQAAKLESDLHARAAELAGLKSAAVEQGAQLTQLQRQIQAIAGRMKEPGTRARVQHLYGAQCRNCPKSLWAFFCCSWANFMYNGTVVVREFRSRDLDPSGGGFGDEFLGNLGLLTRIGND